MDSTYAATVIVFLVFVASIISVEVALSAAIIEIVMGVIAANFMGLHPAPWMDFIAGFGGILLTFLAGIEVDPTLLRQKLKESLLIGGCSFLLPHLAALGYCYWIAHWTLQASLIAGCALSTTSLAVVYAVLVETSLTDTGIGKIMMASTFVTDMGTAIALSLTFAEWGVRTLVVLLACVPLSRSRRGICRMCSNATAVKLSNRKSNSCSSCCLYLCLWENGGKSTRCFRCLCLVCA